MRRTLLKLLALNSGKEHKGFLIAPIVHRIVNRRIEDEERKGAHFHDFIPNCHLDVALHDQEFLKIDS